MIDPSKFKPLGNRVLLFKCANDHVRDDKGKVLVTLTEKSLANTNFLEVVAVGPKCKDFTQEHIGRTVHVKDWSHWLMNMKSTMGDGYWIASERDDAGNPVIQPFVVAD